MVGDYWEPEGWQGRADSYVESAKEAVREIFADATEVQYLKQLEVRLEKDFYHWVTARAVNDLIEEGFLRASQEELRGPTRVKFLRSAANRYPRRKIARAIQVVREYSAPTVAIACGQQAESLFLHAFALRGFLVHGRNLNEYEGRKWTETGHNLDFIIERDQLVYGCEVKNTWDYIDREEMRIKIELCEYLGVIPFFILRYGPKSYLDEIRRRGGVFCLFVAQIYPFGMGELAGKVKEVLQMPADSPRQIPDGIIDRFVNRVHARRVESGDKPRELSI